MAFEETWHRIPSAEVTRGRAARRGASPSLSRCRWNHSQAHALDTRLFSFTEQSRNPPDCGRQLRVVIFCITPEVSEFRVPDVIAPQAVAERRQDTALPLHSLRDRFPTERFHDASIAAVPDSSRVPQTEGL